MWGIFRVLFTQRNTGALVLGRLSHHALLCSLLVQRLVHAWDSLVMGTISLIAAPWWMLGSVKWDFSAGKKNMQLENQSERLFTQGGGSAAGLHGWVSSPALSCCASLAPLSRPLLCANLQPCWLYPCTHNLMWPEIPQQPRFSSDPSYGRNLR